VGNHWKRGAAHLSQKGIATGCSAQMLGDLRTGFRADTHPKDGERVSKSLRAPGIRRCDRVEPLAEKLLRTARVLTSKAAYVQDQFHRAICQGISASCRT